jgi:IS605 OrfB family transposase
LAELLDYAYYHNVGIVLFEDLEQIKKRKFTNCRKANRKISKFAKRELLHYGVTMSLKRGFKVFLVNPSYTSKIAKCIHSKYVLARKFIKTHKCS